MKKKLLSVVLCTAMVASLFTGCGSTGNETTNEGASTEGTATEGSSETASVDASEITGEITVLTNRTDLVDTKFAEYAETFEEMYLKVLQITKVTWQSVCRQKNTAMYWHFLIPS